MKKLFVKVQNFSSFKNYNYDIKIIVKEKFHVFFSVRLSMNSLLCLLYTEYVFITLKLHFF